MSAEAQQLQNESVAAMQDVETYRFETSVDASTDDQSISLDADGLINRTARRAKLDMRVSVGDEVTMYLVENTAYVKAGETGDWIVRDMSDRNMWDQQGRLERQQELLAASGLEITGNATVDGVPVHVAEVDVPQDKLDELTQLAQQQSGSSSDASISDATYTVYIATDSKLMRKVTVDMTIESDGQSADTSVSMRFFDFGTDATIEVPEEATQPSGSTAALAPPGSSGAAVAAP